MRRGRQRGDTGPPQAMLSHLRQEAHLPAAGLNTATGGPTPAARRAPGSSWPWGRAWSCLAGSSLLTPLRGPAWVSNTHVGWVGGEKSGSTRQELNSSNSDLLQLYTVMSDPLKSTHDHTDGHVFWWGNSEASSQQGPLPSSTWARGTRVKAGPIIWEDSGNSQ